MVKYSLFKKDGSRIGEYDLDELTEYKSTNYYVMDGDDQVLVGNFLKKKETQSFNPDKTTFFSRLKPKSSVNNKTNDEAEKVEDILNEPDKSDELEELGSLLDEDDKKEDEVFEFREFKVDSEKTVIQQIDYEDLEKNYQDNHPNNSIELILKKKIQEDKAEEQEREDLENEGKTKLVNFKKKQSQDKTRIVPLTASQLLQVEKLKKEIEEKENPKAPEEKVEVVEDKTDYHGVTVVAKMGDKLSSLIKKSSKAEYIFEQKEEEQNKKDKEERLSELKKKRDERRKEQEESEDVKEKPKIKMKPLFAIVFALVFGFFIFDDDGATEKSFQPVYAKISFPTPYELENKKKAKSFRKKGLDLYGKKTYKAKLYAAGMFKKSLEHQFESNKALGDLILTYSELLDNVKDPIRSGQKIFQLVKIGKTRLLSDVKVVSGTANFYSFYGKYDAAINIIENFLRTKKPPTSKLFSIYLDVLIKGGKLDTARKVFQKLQTVPKKTFEVYNSLIQFLILDDNFEEARKLTESALKKYGKSVVLQLTYAKILLTFQDFKQLSKTLKIIKKLSYENNPNYYAKYLEYVGMIKAVQKNYDTAAKIFQKALKIKESDELRSRISQLELGGDTQIRSLILESKIIDIVKRSQLLSAEKKWTAALDTAIEGVDLDPESIPARINLANLQIEQGFYNRAIQTLDYLLNKYPTNRKITFSLVNAYLESYKLNDAKGKLARMVDTRLGNTHEFAFYFGKYYNLTGSLGLAYKWLKEAINRNPLDDHSYFYLAKALLGRRQYARAKSYLLKAMELDPQNIEYKSLYGKIIYELDGPQTAIGFLRDVLISFPDNPRLLSDIAIYYFKSGQIKNFDTQKDLIIDMPDKDPALYRLLINAAKVEEKYDKVVQAYTDLIRSTPGDIRSRMEFSKYLLDEKKYDLALTQLESIKDRLQSYPELYYLISKSYFLSGNLVKAEEAANKEIKFNPSLDAGYTLLGKVHAKKGEINPAIHNLRKALSLNQKSVDALMSLAFIRYNQHHLDEALNLYLRALKEDSNNPAIHKQLGYIYRAQGQSKLAIETFQVYLNLDPVASDQKKIKRIIQDLR